MTSLLTLLRAVEHFVLEQNENTRGSDEAPLFVERELIDDAHVHAVLL